MACPASCGAFSSGSHRLDLLAHSFVRRANFQRAEEVGRFILRECAPNEIGRDSFLE
jgi:hypothetical protein